MNKKFSTLMAGLLLAAVGVTAQNAHPGNGEVLYRTDKVKSAVTSEHCNAVYKIDGKKWYQLVVKVGKAADGTPLGSETTVLTMERDYPTGALHLEVKKVEDAALTHSLWQIQYTQDAVSGHNYTFVNKETGYALTFDHTRAFQIATNAQAADVAAAVGNTEATILDGCNDMWTWYSNDNNGNTPFSLHKVYSYYHQTSNVLALAQNTNGGVVLVSAPQDIAKVDATGLNKIIELEPVIAGAKVLSAEEVNTMIDADGSYKDFAVNNINGGNTTNGLQGEVAKFNSSVEMDNNPLASAAGLVAVESNVTALNRNNYDNTYSTIVTGQKSIYAGYNVLFKDPSATNYLQVTTDYLEKPSTASYNGLKLAMAPYTNPAEIDAKNARFHFKVTYYPTNDSLVVEPLNAAMPDKEGNLADLTPAQYLNTINAGVAYGTAAPAVANCLFNKAAGVPVALAAINFGGAMDAKYSLTVNVPYRGIGLPTDGLNVSEIKYAAICKEDWACAAHSTGKAVNPAYVTFYCVNHDGPDNHQNEGVEYNADMQMKLSFMSSYYPLKRGTVPSGLYFVRLSTANPDKNDVTSTQKRADGSYIVADMGGHLVYDVQETTQDFKRMPATQWVIEQLGCDKVDPAKADPTYNKAPRVKITNREYGRVGFEGQLYDAGDGKYYIINHRDYTQGMGVTGTDYHMNAGMNNRFSCADTIYFEKIEKPNAYGYALNKADDLAENVYALHHGNVNAANLYLGVNSTDNYVQDLAGDPTFFELHHIVAAEGYGYTGTGTGVPALARDVYTIKVKDANKIDNDHKYIALDHMHRYIVAKESDIQEGKDGLRWALFYLKENNYTNDAPYYSLVNATADFTMVGDAIYKNNKVDGKFAIEALTNSSYIDPLCGTTSDVFALTINPRPLYKTLSKDAAFADYVNNLKQSATLSTIFGNEYLFEKMKSGVLNYLAVENKSAQTENEGLYVDYVAKSSARMPQYLLAVDADSVGAYYYCGENAHGATHGLNPTCDHKVQYPGYVSGRFLVNLNDSVQNSINKVENPSKFQSDNYTRLAFVEGVHRGDNLYILKYPYTLRGENAITGTDADGNVLVIPDSLAADKAGIIYDIVTLDGKHNNAAFSFRYVGDTEEEGFLLESYDGAKGSDKTPLSAIGSFEGAWLRIVNGIPVVAKFHNQNGNHNTGDLVDGNNNEGVKDMGQVISQAAILKLGTVDKVATSNENDPVVSEVKVVSGKGTITILNAANKTVKVSNMLGQSLAGTVLTSDNATINVPAGIVVVAVEGEEAVKAIVK